MENCVKYSGGSYSHTIPLNWASNRHLLSKFTKNIQIKSSISPQNDHNFPTTWPHEQFFYYNLLFA